MSDTKHPTYWRSLGELANTPEFRARLETEFPIEESREGFSRRRMLQLMGASMVLAAAGSCRWKEREVLPFNKRPEGYTPGKFERYATAMELGGSVLGLLVTCVDGRPIKVEGNPKHPNSLGATNAFAQAAILELYDPDRSRHIVEKTPEGDMVRSWEQFTAFANKHFEEYRKNGGEGLAVISEPSNSPTFISLRNRLIQKFPKAKWCVFDPLGELRSTRERHLRLQEAEVVLCVEADIFGSHPEAVKLTREYMENRDLDGSKRKRLYVVESSYSITGAMADHRLALSVGDIFRFIDDLEEIKRLLTEGSKENSGGEEATKTAIDDIVAGRKSDNAQRDRFLASLAKDIFSHPGKVEIAVGKRLKNYNDLKTYWMDREFVGVFGGETDKAKETFPPFRAEGNDGKFQDHFNSIDELAEAVGSQKVSSIWVLSGNPVYSLPADSKFREVFSKVPCRVHLGRYFDETSQACTWHVPAAHFLESWGDTSSADLFYSVIQPMIDPLFGGKSAIELLLLALGGEPAKIRDEIRAVCQLWMGESDFEKRWKELLHDGFTVAGSAWREGSDDPFERLHGVTRLKEKSEGLEITFRPSPAVYDGRFANLSWLQEMPNPITRLTWDNVALFSPATAEKLGVKHEEIVRLKFKGREIEIPAYILPGQADGSVAVTLGYGRTAAGKVGGSEKDGVPPVGVNTYKLRTSDAMYYGVGLTVEPTGKMHPLASVAEHFAIDKDAVAKKAMVERVPELVREMTVEEYRRKAEGGEKKDNEHKENESSQPSPSAPLPKGEGSAHDESLWEEHKYPGHCWGMTVDLSKCVGCGACVVACMAENNVPVVGKERIFKNREMHWLRIDRYFQGDLHNPRIVFQPVMCQQCEMAPCEGVCPVGATAHSKEGLNEMVYNRCVGTRYCANNCPYKVRRFNFFNYHKQYEEADNKVLKMASNPQVTVRMRGVMEKCTYCVQRIQAAKIAAKNEKRPIADGEIVTACQQVCSAGAIVFGDLNDKNSAVSRSMADSRAYHLLGELYTKPRTAYLARIRNPNPELDKQER
jgi:molybdopterin-containing oxidoreductase family iron-sulfur binding subunit